MTTPTQGELRSWARSQGIAVGDRGSLPAAVKIAYLAAQAHTSAGPRAVPATSPSPPAPADLAGGLRGFLDAVDTEVRAVSALSERTDHLVTDLNGLREDQARRLSVLDNLKNEATDPQLTAFLKKVINPATTQVSEIIPTRVRE